jgi:hypothetical protein
MVFSVTIANYGEELEETGRQAPGSHALRAPLSLP